MSRICFSTHFHISCFDAFFFCFFFFDIINLYNQLITFVVSK